MSALAKIPCILATGVALHVGHTPPTTSPPKNEQVDRNVGNIYLWFIQASLGFIKATYWAPAIAEIAVILASHISSPISQYVLDALAKNGTKMEIPFTPPSIAGMLLILMGGFLRYQCYRTLKKFFTFEVSIRGDHELITAGPYSVVRHPSYTGAIAQYFGNVLWHSSRGSWLRESGVMETTLVKVYVGIFVSLDTMVMIALLMRTAEEDRLLKKSFGKKWDAWAAKVPYRIIPGVF